MRTHAAWTLIAVLLLVDIADPSPMPPDTDARRVPDFLTEEIGTPCDPFVREAMVEALQEIH